MPHGGSHPVSNQLSPVQGPTLSGQPLQVGGQQFPQFPQLGPTVLPPQAQLATQGGSVVLNALSELFSGPSIQEQAFEQVQQRVGATPQIDPSASQSQALRVALPQLQQQAQTAQQRFGIGSAQAFEQIFADFQERQQRLQLQAQMQAQLQNLQTFVQNTQLLASFG